MSPRYRLVTIGCSAGGFDALRTILPALPVEFPVTIAVVLHQPADGNSVIAEAMRQICPFPVKEAEDKENFRPGVLYFAPPGYHLLVERQGSFSLSVDPPVNHSRPSIDLLFETAALAFGPAVVGLVLSGANADGAAGLKCIVEQGGYGAVQTPESAAFEAMPKAAIEAASPQRLLPLEEISVWLAQLARTGEV